MTYTLEELTLDFLQDNYVDIEYGLAKTFNLIYETEKDGTIYTHLTGSVKIEHFREPTVKTGESDKISKIWDVVEYGPLSLTLPYGSKGEITKYVQFYSYVNWYFAELNEAFYEKLVVPTRTLFVYTDLVQTQLVGCTETDLLKEVVINTSFKGRTQFEPRRIQYIPVRKNRFDTVEVGISETNGPQTRFDGGETILTIKFKRRSQPN